MTELQHHQPTNTALARQTGVSLRDVLRPTTLNDALSLAQRICKSSIVPKTLQNDPMAILSLMEFGERVGMGLMESVQNVAIINGKFSIYGDRMKAIVLASGLLEDFKETHEADKDGKWVSATCWAKRKGIASPAESTFSIKMAQRAGLERNPTWKSYPERMLTMRARGFVLRDLFSDVLAGMITREEANDYAYDAATGEQVPMPASAKLRDVTPVDATPPDAPPDEPRETKQADLGMVLRGIDMAETLDHLDQVTAIAKDLPSDMAAEARARYLAKRKQLVADASPAKSKAQRLMEEREGGDQGPVDEGPPLEPQLF